MNFEHSEHRAMLVQSLSRFLSDRYAFEPLVHMKRAEKGFNRDDWCELARLGTIAALFPEESGGLGGSGFDIMAVFESIGRTVMIEPVLGTLIAGEILRQSCSEQHRSILEQSIDGRYISAIAHEEAHAHHELSEVRASARLEAGKWVLNGLKVAVPQGGQVDGFLVSARVLGESDDPSGIALFLVPATSRGISVRSFPAIDGGRVADIELNAVELEPEALIGSVDAGYALLERAVNRGILALCAESLGAMDAVKQGTLDYLRTRVQFGVAIGSFQALQHRMADVALEIEQARSAVINAAAAIDGSDAQALDEALSAAKYTVGRVGTLVAEESIQMHGGMGMTWELAVPHHAKRLVMIDHQLGDQDHHLQRYVAALLRRADHACEKSSCTRF